ncbi:M48 metallopeptidase family protein [Allocoleopsis franciscana]|uniref:Putative metal-dependent hydrolase n=1 Tax=Allocoleopsis franciscana PCC 7113 TaxID=1173027 RepID=K9W8K1_9CYAN|nr:M48 family metallopeptidase [Allocoleopsis franciscana]AFZ16725.1 putative metal-dependent hydrolase [Allocoleopsis franciscana PCC 7113]
MRCTTEANCQDTDNLRSLVHHWASKIGVNVQQIHLRPMKTKWASMSTTGRLTLNTDLLTLPQELAEFVIVHELVHLLVPNHDKVFKSFMYAYLPDWEEREQQLQSNYGKTINTNGQDG